MSTISSIQFDSVENHMDCTSTYKNTRTHPSAHRLSLSLRSCCVVCLFFRNAHFLMFTIIRLSVWLKFFCSFFFLNLPWWLIFIFLNWKKNTCIPFVVRNFAVIRTVQNRQEIRWCWLHVWHDIERSRVRFLQPKAFFY